MATACHDKRRRKEDTHARIQYREGASISVNKVIWVPQFSIFHQTYSPEAPFLTKSSMKRDKQPVEKTYLEKSCIDKNTVQIVRIHKSIFYSRDKS